jgi:probable phosphoglycerate mutase
MSDLQCAATIIVARHGEAEYESALLSDDGGSLTRRGREQARELGRSLLNRRIATIWSSEMARAVQTAEIAAGVLGCDVKVRRGLREFGVGDKAGAEPTGHMFDDVFDEWERGNLGVGTIGGETGEQVVRRMSADLDELSDQYRGETTLVVSHGGVMTLALPLLARNVANTYAWGDHVANCATCELAVDRDGWVLRTWQGRPVA